MQDTNRCLYPYCYCCDTPEDVKDYCRLAGLEDIIPCLCPLCDAPVTVQLAKDRCLLACSADPVHLRLPLDEGALLESWRRALEPHVMALEVRLTPAQWQVVREVSDRLTPNGDLGCLLYGLCRDRLVGWMSPIISSIASAETPSREGYSAGPAQLRLTPFQWQRVCEVRDMLTPDGDLGDLLYRLCEDCLEEWRWEATYFASAKTAAPEGYEDVY